MGGVLAAAAGGDGLPINDVGLAKGAAVDVAFKVVDSSVLLSEHGRIEQQP